VDAIAQHQPEAAAEAMRAHLTRANQLYLNPQGQAS
jgi:DNA-binding FadR family transcriptional regulator